MTPEQVIVAYNRATARALKPGQRPLTQSAKKTRRDAAAFLAWCSSESVDPVRLIMARHEAIRWRVRVPLASMKQASPAFLAKFRDWGESVQGEAQSQARIARQARTEPAHHHKATILGESLKAAMAQDPNVCLASPETGGWVADSAWCGACPVAPDCRRQRARS